MHVAYLQMIDQQRVPFGKVYWFLFWCPASKNDVHRTTKYIPWYQQLIAVIDLGEFTNGGLGFSANVSNILIRTNPIMKEGRGLYAAPVRKRT